jgi:hypothetical protein
MGMLVILWDANIFPRDNVDEEIIHLASAHRLSDVTALRERGRSGVGSQGKKKRGREGREESHQKSSAAIIIRKLPRSERQFQNENLASLSEEA